MSFPTTSLLDDFTRANENPLSDGGNWSGPGLMGDGNPLRLVSDAAVSPAGTPGDSLWVGDMGPAQEVWATFHDDGSFADSPTLFAMLGNPNSGSETGYYMYNGGAGTVLLAATLGGAWGGGSAGVTLADGDSYGMRVDSVAQTLEMWHKPVAGGWTLLQTFTGVNDWSSGQIGVGGYITTEATITSFGGGAVTPGPPPPAAAPSTRGLSLVATDLLGVPKGSPGKPLPVQTVDQPSVTIPLNDSRTGSVAVSMFDPISGVLSAADTALKVFYTNPKGTKTLLLNAIVMQPTADFDAATVAVTLHDPTIRLKKRNLGYGHVGVILSTPAIGAVSDGSVDAATGGTFNGLASTYGIPLDGRGLRVVIYDAAHGTLDRAGTAPFGIRYKATESLDATTPQADYVGTAPAVPPASSIYCQLSRGDNCWADVTDMVQAAGSFECAWVPVDANNLGPSATAWDPAKAPMCELYTADRIGVDRSQGNGVVTPVVFVHGQGGFHLTHAPSADDLRTYIVEVGPGGPTDPLDIDNRVTLIGPSADTFGLWEDWEQATSAGTGDNPISNDLLEARAAAILTAYQSPPKYITATIDSDAIGGTAPGTLPYCYPDDFAEGDTVTVYAQRGHVTVGPMPVRITSVGVTQVDKNGNCQLALTMVPHLVDTSGIGTGT